MAEFGAWKLPVQLPPAVDRVAQEVYRAHLKLQDVMSAEHNIIPHQAWELQFAAQAGLSISQARFVIALFSSVLIAAGVRLFRSPTVRHLYALVTGIAVVYYPFGSGIIHVAPMGALAYGAMVLVPRRAGSVAWATVFMYLVYLHVCNASGEAWKAGQLDFTGGAMVVALKLLSLCQCRQDSFRKDKEDLTPYQAAHVLPRLPSPLQFLSYLFGLGNLLAGPWVEYTDYTDFIERKGLWDPRAARPMPGTLLPGLADMAQGLLFMAMFLGLSLSGWNPDHYLSDWYFAQPLWRKCAAFVIIGGTSQLRFYFTWKVTEAAYTFAGLNFLGWQDGQAKWGRCRNVNFFGVWLTDSARNVPLNWNICTGTFLRRYVYERVTPKGRKPGFSSLMFTQLVSAVWHGLYPGYLMFFAGTAVWIYFSQIVYKAEAYLPRSLAGSVPWYSLKVVWTTFVLNYMASAFLTLRFDTTMRSYSTVYYFPWILMFTVNVLGSFLKSKRPPRSSPAANGAAHAAAAAVAKQA